MPEQKQQFVYEDFSGGLTDNVFSEDYTKFAKADNFDITDDKKLKSRYGFTIYDAAADNITSNARIGGLGVLEDASPNNNIIAFSGRNAYRAGNGAWSSLLGPTTTAQASTSGTAATSDITATAFNLENDLEADTYGWDSGTSSFNSKTFDGNFQKWFAQRVTISNNGNSFYPYVSHVRIKLKRLGTPNGNISVQIVKNSGGQPSTSSADIVAASSSMAINNIATSFTSYDFALGHNFGTNTIPTAPATATHEDPVYIVGDSTTPQIYHVVVAVDGSYSYSSSVNELSIVVDDDTAIPGHANYASVYNASWATAGSNYQICYQLLYKPNLAYALPAIPGNTGVSADSTGQPLFDAPNSGATSDFSSHEWNGHLFATNTDRPHPVKIFEDNAGTLRGRTAGLPFIEDQFSTYLSGDSATTIESNLIALAEDIRESIGDHFFGNPIDELIALAEDCAAQYTTHIADAAKHTGASGADGTNTLDTTTVQIGPTYSDTVNNLVAFCQNLYEKYNRHVGELNTATPKHHAAPSTVDKSVFYVSSERDVAIFLWNFATSQFPNHEADGTAHGDTTSNAITADPNLTVYHHATHTNAKNEIDLSPFVNLDFDGTDDYARRAESGYRSADSAGTIQAWVNFDALGSEEYIFGCFDEAGTQNFLAVYKTSGDEISVIHDDAGSQDEVATSGASLVAGKWHHIAVVSSGSAYTIYIDGVSQTLSVVSGTNSGDWFADITAAPHDNIVFGAKYQSSVASYLSGKMGKVAVYSAALAATQITKDFEELTMSSTNRVGYWAVDEATGTTLADADNSKNLTTSGPSWESLVNLKRIVKSLVRAYNLHSADIKKDDPVYHNAFEPQAGDRNRYDLWWPSNTEQTLDYYDEDFDYESLEQLTVVLNDLRLKYNTHINHLPHHGPGMSWVVVILSDINFDYIDTESVRDVVYGPGVKFNWGPIYELANEAKHKINLHKSNADPTATASHTHDSPPGAGVSLSEVADATDEASFRTLMWNLQWIYWRHIEEDTTVAEYAMHGFSSTTQTNEFDLLRDHFLTLGPAIDHLQDWDGGYARTTANGYNSTRSKIERSISAQVAILNDLIVKYNLHVNSIDTSAGATNGVGSHGSTTFDPPYDAVTGSIGAILSPSDPQIVLGSYLYAMHYECSYKVGTKTFIDRGPVHTFQVKDHPAINHGPLLIENIPVLTNGTGNGSTAYDIDNITVQIYRTTNGGTVFYKVGEVSNGTEVFQDTIQDEDLVNNETLYTTGGELADAPPPRCAYFHINGDYGYYANVIIESDTGKDDDGDGLIDRSAVTYENRLYQSKAANIDAVPRTNYAETEGVITGVSSAKSRTLVFEANRIYRVEGAYTDSGSGGMTLTKITDGVGCVSNAGIVQVDESALIPTGGGVFFPAKDGFYFTDGYQVSKLSNEFNATYLALIDKDKIKGAYDKDRNIVYWGAKQSGAEDDGNPNTMAFKLHLNVGLRAFTTMSGNTDVQATGTVFQPEALAFFDGEMLHADNRGYLFNHTSSAVSDPAVDTATAAGSWGTTKITEDYRSLHNYFGSWLLRKVAYMIRFVFKGESTAVQCEVYESVDASTLRKVNSAAAYSTSQGSHSIVKTEKLRPLNDKIRCTTRQIQIKNTQKGEKVHILAVGWDIGTPSDTQSPPQN